MRRENAQSYSVVIVRGGGRSSIPGMPVMESIGHGVLDTRLRGYDDLSCRDSVASLAMTVTGSRAQKERKSLRRPRHRFAPARPARLCRVGSLPVCRQQRPDIGRRLRRAEQIALHFRTAEFAQQIALLLGLDAFAGAPL